MEDMNRTEKDSLGTITLPHHALYGANTQRALQSFPPQGQKTLGDYSELVDALLRIKWAAADLNRRIELLDEVKAEAIIESARTLLEKRLYDQFPLCRFHGGGGSAMHINANEVLANSAEERLGGRRGEYRLVHPNDHVNLNQSTNDVFPTACHMAIISASHGLNEALVNLAEALSRKAGSLRKQPRLARTCLQDAVEVTFGDLFDSYAAFIRRSGQRIRSVVEALYSINLGGTIVGRTQDAPEAYRREIIPTLVRVTGDTAYRPADNLFDVAQNPDDMVAVSAALELAARGIIKIAGDLRLLGSGPEAGLGEIRLPPVEAGSSIMPGKINPVVPESAIQCCLQVMGQHCACAGGLDHGELDLNIWEPIMVFNILDSIELLSRAANVLEKRCIEGLSVIPERNVKNVNTIIPQLTRLMHEHGYSTISDICRSARGDMLRLRALLKSRGFISDEQNESGSES
jgi:aspartate ammonia-lyase